MTHLHVNKLEDFIDFDNDVVNKEYLLESPTGKVKLVALKKHQEIPTHVAPSEAMVYVIDGEIKFYIKHEGVVCTDCGCGEAKGEMEFKIKKGEFLRFHKDEEHHVIAEKDTKMLVAYV